MAAVTASWKRERVCTSASCMVRTARSSSATSLAACASLAALSDTMPWQHSSQSVSQSVDQLVSQFINMHHNER